MWYTKPDNTDVVEGNPMKEKTYQTRCGTIHYWANASNPDIRRAVALENLISDGRQPDIAEIQTRIRVTVDHSLRQLRNFSRFVQQGTAKVGGDQSDFHHSFPPRFFCFQYR